MESPLQFKIGIHTVQENLDRSVAEGHLIQHEDGTYALPEKEDGSSPWLHASSKKHLDCGFSMGFLFKHAYGKSAVPHGCKDCYKVVVLPRTLKQLMALRTFQKSFDCNAKCGTEVDRPTTQNVYSGFFYCITLEEARSVYRKVRQAVDEDPVLGPEVPMRIKRGCTEYELACGPADQYTFAEELPELEAHLKSRFRRTKRAPRNPALVRLETLTGWIETAFRIGDNTYLEFTRGKRLYPELVTFDPELADNADIQAPNQNS
jgi:hypothetical protein